jgi:hypothetical protein
MSSFAWAIEELKAGKKVRRASWFHKYYMFKAVDRNLVFSTKPGYYSEYKAEGEDIFATDWENKA